MVTDEQLAKLPRYARWEIERLRLNEEFALKIAEQAKADMLQRGGLDIGNGKRIDWVLRVDGEIDISAYDGVLEILPRASNGVTLRIKRFGER